MINIQKDKNGFFIILSKEEVGCILSSVDTIKHKAILMLMHINGLFKGRKDSGTDLRYIQEY